MKRSAGNSATAAQSPADPGASLKVKARGNGHAKETDGLTIDLALTLASLHSMRDGDFSVRLPGAWTGLAGKIADTFNDIVAANQQMAIELTRVGQAVGKEGRTRERAKFRASRGAWGEMETSVNSLMEDLLRPTAEVTRAIAAVAQGNLTQTVRLDVDGRRSRASSCARRISLTP